MNTIVAALYVVLPALLLVLAPYAMHTMQAVSTSMRAMNEWLKRTPVHAASCYAADIVCTIVCMYRTHVVTTAAHAMQVCRIMVHPNAHIRLVYMSLL